MPMARSLAAVRGNTHGYHIGQFIREEIVALLGRDWVIGRGSTGKKNILHFDPIHIRAVLAGELLPNATG